ncbi:hypothetical protein R9X47_10270 [Wukongibacter baidiensis]|uniref:hypothetical protein n=1 Tax=Wukongibacter baidiensis TaxID=1723361 RepID=UPI003D7FA3E7
MKKNLTKLRKMYIAISTLTIIVGLMYVNGIYGPTESEVVFWGFISIIIGIIIAVIGNKSILLNCMLYSVNIAMQVLPISLWFTFHGRGISDGTPPSNFIAHWIFSLPHILILALCSIAILYSIYNKE